MQPWFFEQCLQDLRLSAAQFGKIFDVPEVVVRQWLTGAALIPSAVEVGLRCLWRYKSMNDAGELVPRGLRSARHEYRKALVLVSAGLPDDPTLH
jgi:hypothetical protein